MKKTNMPITTAQEKQQSTPWWLSRTQWHKTFQTFCTTHPKDPPPHTHTCTHTHKRLHTHTHTCTNVHTHTCAHKHTHTHARTHAHTLECFVSDPCARTQWHKTFQTFFTTHRKDPPPPPPHPPHPSQMQWNLSLVTKTKLRSSMNAKTPWQLITCNQKKWIITQRLNNTAHPLKFARKTQTWRQPTELWSVQQKSI